jgi:hypothetical protein
LKLHRSIEGEEGRPDMNQQLSRYAEALVFVHGRGAAEEAARHAILCERSGDTETATTWKKLVEELRRRRAKLDG